MNIDWIFEPRLHLLGHSLSVAGVVGAAVTVVIGFILSTLIHGERSGAFVSRLGVDKKFVGVVTGALGLAMLISCLVAALGILGFRMDWEETIPGLGISLAKALRLAALLIAVFWFSSASKRFLFNRYFARMETDRAVQYAIAQVFGYLVLVAGLFIVLQNAGIDLSTLTVFAGAVGVGVGFGLQNIASNFVSGLVLLAERPIKIGDRVEVEKVAGIVKEIRARSTTVVTNDNISIIVPNSRFIEQPITNWTHGDPKVRFRIPVSVAYGSDMKKVCTTLVALARAHPAALQVPEPGVFFNSFGDSALNLELVVWSEQMSYRPRRFRSDLNFAIEEKFREAGIVIPFPQREVRLLDGAPELPAEVSKAP